MWHLKHEFEYLLGRKPDGAGKSASKKKKTEPVESKQADDSPQQGNGKRARQDEMEPPKKYKSAFNFFVKAKRKETEVELGDQMSVDTLKAKLLEKWEALDQAGKSGKYNALAEEDKKRFDRENAEYAKFLSAKKTKA